eukprot:jgi/Mesen1/4248/ME000022S03532
MEEDRGQDDKLELAQKLFLLRSRVTSDPEKDKLKDEVLEAIKKDDLVLLYQSLCEELSWTADQQLLEKMKNKIAEELTKLDDRIKDAEENLGESEVREANLSKAVFFIRIGDKERALEQLKVTEAKTVAVGQKMDLVFHILRLGFYDLDFDLIATNIEKAKSLFEEGGDWERKNRLKVYEGLYLMATRCFKKGADLFLDSISTFTTYELFPYDLCIFYTVLTSVVSLTRVQIKQKVVDAPEILTVIGDIPHLTDFLNALHNCQYKKFFVAFAGLTEAIRRDRYLYPHLRYFMREVRVVAYSQFLESYKSVTLEAMSRAFGVGIDFLDRELSMFIAAGRLNCKIDKVTGVLETNRPDAKNALYQQTLKQGDLLLNRIQKLSRVIDV